MAQSTSPRAAGRGEQAISFSRCDPHPSHRHTVRILPLSAPIFARECRRWLPASHDLRFEPRSRRKKARKRNADRRVANDRTLRGAARAERRALASRRPTTALARGTLVPKAQLQARLPGTWFPRALPGVSCPSPVAAPHAPVVMPASMMPEPARERSVWLRAQAPHPLHLG